MEIISKDEMKSNDILLDIRTKDEFELGTINNSINIDFLSEDFKDKLNQLDKNKRYVIFCKSGGRCLSSLSIFSELGFNEVVMLDGNYEVNRD
jgi:rhodanese-related sulfurtransferase